MVSDEEMELAVAVARREGWADLGSPPEDHPPRTLSEALAVARLQQARTQARARSRAGGPAGTPRWAWGVMIALAVAILGVCWWVSPGRTVAGLVVVAVFVTVGLLRRRRPGTVRRRSPFTA
jgi:Flp pilus assembly protein TadB